MDSLIRDPGTWPIWTHVVPASRADLMTNQRLAVSSPTAFAFACSASSAATSDTSDNNCAAVARAWSLPGTEISPGLVAAQVLQHFEKS